MALISDEIIAQVIDRCDIVEVISSYTPLKRTGQNFKANCPFHNEKTPSFVVNPNKQIFHCFGCGVGGNVISFVMKHDHLEFPEAIRMLAAKVNIVIPEDDYTKSPSVSARESIFKVNELAVQYFHNILLSDKDPSVKVARDYLKKRSVTLEMVQQFQLGFALDNWSGLLEYLKSKDIPLSLMEKAGLIIARENRDGFYDRFRHRIIFPIFDTRGNCRAFGARALDEAAGAKYINSPETPVYTKGHHLYGFHAAKQSILQNDAVIIVEGYMDCLMPHQVGVTNVVASLGTALTVEQIRLLRRYTKNVIFLFDMDAAGESAMLRSLDMLLEEEMNVMVVSLLEGEDPDSFIRKFGVEAFKEKIAQAKSLFDYKLAVLSKKFDPKIIENKAKISAEMLTTINKFQNAIVRSGYLERLAKELLIPQQALQAEMKKSEVKEEGKPSRDLDVHATKQVHQIRTVETDILKLLLHEGSYIVSTKEAISSEDFQDTHIREIISKMFELCDQGRKVDIGMLMGSFDDSEKQKIISELAVQEGEFIGDKNKMHRDYIDRIKSYRLKSQTKFLMQQIKEAENLGDHLKVESLLKEFNQLIRK